MGAHALDPDDLQGVTGDETRDHLIEVVEVLADVFTGQRRAEMRSKPKVWVRAHREEGSPLGVPPEEVGSRDVIWEEHRVPDLPRRARNQLSI